MSLADKVLAVNNDLPIRTDQPIHSGKVRSVYWLTKADSQRLIKEKNYDVSPDAPLAVMVISDRISAFECIWQGEGGMHGIPGKGAALNAISNHWFKLFKENGLADSHILDIPHPLDCPESQAGYDRGHLPPIYHRVYVARLCKRRAPFLRY